MGSAPIVNLPPPLALRASHAAFRIGETPILADLDFDLRQGEWTFLIAPPGAGKTTLLRLVAGEIAPTSGKIERAGAAALVLHDTRLDDTKSARSIVAEAMIAEPDAANRADALLCDLGLDAYLNHEPFRLSRGHYKRLAIARALAARPALFCLDDPFSPMDRRARLLTANALARAADESGLAILMASNDPFDALRYGDRIVALTPAPDAQVEFIEEREPTPDATEEQLTKTPLFDRLQAVLWGDSR